MCSCTRTSTASAVCSTSGGRRSAACRARSPARQSTCGMRQPARPARSAARSPAPGEVASSCSTARPSGRRPCGRLWPTSVCARCPLTSITREHRCWMPAHTGSLTDRKEITTMRDQLERYWKDLAAMARRMPMGALAEVAEVLLDCYQRGGTVFVLGNGGSAATASHFACDLGKGTRSPGAPPFRVVALTDNAALMTAWANDTSYDRVFAEQLVALVRPGDIVVAISASGESPNVLLAAQAANDAGALTIALTGPKPCRLHDLADFIVREIVQRS